MTVAELIALLAGAPADAVVVTHDGGHDRDEIAAAGIETVGPDDRRLRPFDIPNGATFVRIV